MLKIAGLICMIAGGAGVGYSMSVQVGRRYHQLQELQRMAAFLMGEITYGNTPLPDGMEQIGKRLEEPFSSFMKKLSMELRAANPVSLQEIFDRLVWQELKATALTPKDLEMLSRLGKSLGYLDRDMQIRTMKLYETELIQEMQDTHHGMAEKKKLCRTLGIMGGLFLAILLL